MKTILALAVAATAIMGVTSSADARDGCGRGFFRGPAGHCRPIGGRPGYVVGPRIGIFYPGRGYWDGRRYWMHRYHHRGEWRYR